MILKTRTKIENYDILYMQKKVDKINFLWYNEFTSNFFNVLKNRLTKILIEATK